MPSVLTFYFRKIYQWLLTTVMLGCFLISGGVCHGATVINIGDGNVVNTNSVSGCVQGSGSLKEEDRTLPEFHGLDVDGAFIVTISGQKNQAVSLSADDNLLPLILTEVSDGVLRITTRKPVCTGLPMTVRISVKTLDQISSGGANSFKISDLKSSALNLNLSGTSNMNLSGQTTKLTASLEGASEIRATALLAEKVFLSISGTGSADVYAGKALHADITGVGNVRYSGNPSEVVRNIIGWGSVTPLD